MGDESNVMGREGKEVDIEKALKTENGVRFTELCAEKFKWLITVQEVMHPIF